MKKEFQKFCSMTRCGVRVCVYTQGMTTTNTTKKSVRKSRCNACASVIVEKALRNAADIAAHDDAYGEDDDALVWIDSEKRAMCYASNFSTAHATDREVCGN